MTRPHIIAAKKAAKILMFMMFMFESILRLTKAYQEFLPMSLDLRPFSKASKNTERNKIR